jgi:hypothetical protein
MEKTHFFMGKSTISTGPFSIAMYSYVSLPEGMLGWGKEFCGDGHRLKQIEKGIE